VLRTTDLDYDLPPEAIATMPAPERSNARMLVVPSDGSPPQDLCVRDLPGLLRRGDLLVRNRTRVVPARFVGTREDTGAKAEGLFLREVGPSCWAAMIKTRRVGEGVVLRLCDGAGAPSGVRLRLRSRLDEPGAWEVDVSGAEGRSAPDILRELGRTPLPPYILAARKHAGLEVADATDRERYQTCFAQGVAASVAAPTAGLHLTPELEASLVRAGIGIADVELQVGTGTFRSVETEFVEQHPMHEELCLVPAETRRRLDETAAAGGRVICIGTTSARTLEAAAAVGQPCDAWYSTRLLITPGYQFRATHGLLTNFHLPRSTLLALVGAMFPGGVPRLLETYSWALEHGYRFYSYGDAMLLLPDRTK